MRFCIGLFVLGFLLTSGVPATTYLVRPDGTGDFPTIQAAVDGSVAGDVIELANGTFIGPGNRDVDYRGKAVTIRSQSGLPEGCVIDCQGSETEPHRAFLIYADAEWLALEGVTIVGGCHDWGGGVHAAGEAPMVRGCRFIDNQSPGSEGGGLCCAGNDAEIVECWFRNNSAFHGGGASACGMYATFTRCTFVNNTAVEEGGGARY